MSTLYDGWRFVQEIVVDAEGKVAGYKVHLHRKYPDSAWYDEIRYDTHESKRGRRVQAPHLHVKLRCRLEEDRAVLVDQLKSFIDNELRALEAVWR